MTRYPTIEETFAVHAKSIARFGGAEGIRDRAALESALARPRSGHYSDVIQEATAWWESLSQNHAFLDGNKRVAVTMTAAFRVNGYRLEFNDCASRKSHRLQHRHAERRWRQARLRGSGSEVVLTCPTLAINRSRTGHGSFGVDFQGGACSASADRRFAPVTGREFRRRGVRSGDVARRLAGWQRRARLPAPVRVATAAHPWPATGASSTRGNTP